MKRKQFALIIALVNIVFSQSAFAARFGGGGNRGMQRSQPTYNSNRNNNYSGQQNYNKSAPTNNTANNAQPQRQGMGVGTAAVLGAAAGAAGGYMLGSHNSSQQQASPQQTASDTIAQNQTIEKSITNSQTPWGIIGILAALLILGLMFFRKKSNPGFPNSNNNYPNNNNFNMQNNQQNDANKPNNFQQKMQNMVGGNNNQTNKNNIDNNERMADGIENIYFLRQAKGVFLHIQSMNNPDNLTEIAKYLTPALYNEIKDEMANNLTIADFSVLNCSLVSSNIENNQLLASVEFNGMVSENPDEAPKPFNEIWNFIKPDIKNNKWLVAGIQQKETPPVK
ncbi:MAG: 39S ribosomal protein L45 [Proteobacteria bacterium]|nr:39S ribosomal protein L45 [Pseudomonadota bacterium]